MARSLDEIIKELDAGYDPSRKLINERVAAIPGQIAAEEAGLKAQEQDYFTNTILGGARERGVGFSGIPEGERARYGATQFLPALARTRAAGTEQQTSLLEVLAGVNREQRSAASGIREGELNRDEQIRQFNEQLAAQERQAAAARATAFNPGGGLPTAQPGGGNGAAPRTDPVQQDAYNDVITRIKSNNRAAIVSDFNATLASARNGNLRDKYKVDVYKQMRPDLFGTIASTPQIAQSYAARPDSNLTKVLRASGTNWSPLGAGMSLARKLF